MSRRRHGRTKPQRDAESALLDVHWNAKGPGGDEPWDMEQDTTRAAAGIGYHVQCSGTWRDGKGAYWYGDRIVLAITAAPATKASAVYVHFRDPENSGREGKITLEGRVMVVGRHADPGLWVKLDVRPDDLKDGTLSVEAKLGNGVNLMIDRVVLMP